MNCKPGDLARYVGSVSKNYGRFVLVVSRNDFCDGTPGWETAPPLYMPDGRRFADCVADVLLRPIRDPGNDATDETLQWLPVPSRERETA